MDVDDRGGNPGVQCGNKSRGGSRGKQIRRKERCARNQPALKKERMKSCEVRSNWWTNGREKEKESESRKEK